MKRKCSEAQYTFSFNALSIFLFGGHFINSIVQSIKNLLRLNIYKK